MIETRNFLHDNFLEVIDRDILNSTRFPWYRLPESSSVDYPFYGHILATRNDNDLTIPSSPYFEDFEVILKIFIDKHELFSDGYEIMRASLNDSLSSSDLFGDAHVDHKIPHMNFILYLTDCSGATIIYDKEYDETQPMTYLNSSGGNSFDVLFTSNAERNKMIAFNGLNYHAIKFKQPDERRVICIWTVRGL